MEKRELLDIINIIRDKSENGKLVVFVGAGVSRNVKGMPSWEDLVREMATEVGYSKCDACKKKTVDCESICLLKDNYSTDELLKIPQHLFNVDEEKYYEIIKKNFSISYKGAPLSQVIFDLNPAHIVTTNYDHLLEQSTNPIRNNYEVIIEDKDLCAPKKNNNYIIKLHGDIDKLNTIVLKEQDYLGFSETHKLIEPFFKFILAGYTLLFVGYSLNDYNIKQTINWLNRVRNSNAVALDAPIGYAIFDEENLSALHKLDLESQNIAVVNVHDMPLIENIPTEINNDIGKRLYSFLKVVNDFTLTNAFSLSDYLDNLVSGLGGAEFLPYKKLMQMLHLQIVNKDGNILNMRTEKDFNRVQEMCECNNPSAQRIKQLFVNAGISKVQFLNWHRISEGTKSFSISDFTQSDLFKDDAYQKYLTNDYAILSKIATSETDAFKKTFYLHFIQFYNKEVFEAYADISRKKFSPSHRLAYLYNQVMLDYISKYTYSLDELREYVQGLSSKVQKHILSFYAELADGSKDKLLYVNDELNKLRHLYEDKVITMGGTLGALYNIKNIAIEMYDFYFYNKLFLELRGDIKKIFARYIEAMLCTNGEYGENKADWFGNASKKDKYAIDFVDWDIITKYISTKDLQNILRDYHVKNLYLRFSNEYLILLFQNLVNSIDSIVQTYQISFWNIISNYLTLFGVIEFSDKELLELEESICMLLSNKKFLSFYFTVNYPNFKLCLRPMTCLCQKIIKQNQLEIVKSILSLNTFYDYFINVNTRDLRDLLNSLLVEKENDGVQEFLLDIIESETNAIYQNRLIWLFNNSITDPSIIEKIKLLLNSNWKKLRSDMFLDFVFSDLIKLDNEKVNCIIQEIIELDKKRSNGGVRKIPDPFDTKIDELCLLIICDKVKNLKLLVQIVNKTPQLEFLLSPETFDYNLVDLSDYMWENIIRKKKYTPYFIQAKDQIVPKIIKREGIGVASEFEKKMLYGLFMSREDLLNPID